MQENWDSTRLIGNTLRGMFTRDTPVRQLMGPVAIAELSGTRPTLGWVALFNLMAMISLNLGLLNLVPCPCSTAVNRHSRLEGIARRDLTTRGRSASSWPARR